jgi:hypothetical protein
LFRNKVLKETIYEKERKMKKKFLWHPSMLFAMIVLGICVVVPALHAADKPNILVI